MKNSCFPESISYFMGSISTLKRTTNFQIHLPCFWLKLVSTMYIYYFEMNIKSTLQTPNILFFSSLIKKYIYLTHYGSQVTISQDRTNHNPLHLDYILMMYCTPTKSISQRSHQLSVEKSNLIITARKTPSLLWYY